MHPFWIGFGIPFVIALMFPVSVEFCLPSSTKPSRWIQNLPPFSIYMLSAFPIAMCVFAATIVNLKEVNDINVFAVKTYGSASVLCGSIAALLLMFVVASVAVLYDFTSRPVGPYILRRGARATEAFALEKELRDAAKATLSARARARNRAPSNPPLPRGRARRSLRAKSNPPVPAISVKIERYQELVQLNLREIRTHGNLVAAAYLSVAWFGTLGCVFYFWYVGVLVLSNQSLPAGTASKLMMIFILLITWFPMRVYMDWYQNYFHKPDWLWESHGLIMGSFLALAALVLVSFISKPEAIIVVCATVNATVLLFGVVLGKFKPDWLRAAAEFLQSLPFFYFFAVYVIFLFVMLSVGVRIMKT